VGHVEGCAQIHASLSPFGRCDDALDFNVGAQVA
jgi:hypothetical protein